MVTLYVHLRDQISKRLHHGLSETIFVNTLTDVREFKKSFVDTYNNKFTVHVLSNISPKSDNPRHSNLAPNVYLK